MSEMHAPRGPRRPQDGNPAITRSARSLATVARQTVLAACCLAWLALGSHLLRADTVPAPPPHKAYRSPLSAVHPVPDFGNPLPGQSTPVPSRPGPHSRGAGLRGVVTRVAFESSERGPRSEHPETLRQPREGAAPGPDRVAFQDPFPGEPAPWAAESGALGDEPGVSPGACELDLPPIHAVTTDIRPSEGDFPFDCAQTKMPRVAEAADVAAPCRGWPGVLYLWEATSYCHNPLYFEEVNLERYGYLGCDDRCGGIPAALLQPILSGAHFFATVPLVPYKMTADPCCECIYSLGHYRPGSPVPHQIHRIPFRPLAGGVQACAITGLIFAIP